MTALPLPAHGSIVILVRGDRNLYSGGRLRPSPGAAGFRRSTAAAVRVTGLPFKVRYERDAAGAPFRTILWIGKLVNLPLEPASEVTHLVSRAPVGSTIT